MAGFFDFLDPIINAFGGGGGSSVPTSVEPDVLGSAAQTAQDTGGSLDAFGGIAPAAISSANPSAFMPTPTIGAPGTFDPASVGRPASLTTGDVVSNPALGQLGGTSGPSSLTNTTAQVGGVTPTMTNAPSYAPPAPEVGTGTSGVTEDSPYTPASGNPMTEAGRAPGSWWSTLGAGASNAASKTGSFLGTMGSNALSQVQQHPWQAAGIALPLAGSLAATLATPGQPKAPQNTQGGFAPMPSAAPTAPSPAALPPLSTATGNSPLLNPAGGFGVNNPWAGLQVPKRFS